MSISKSTCDFFTLSNGIRVVLDNSPSYYSVTIVVAVPLGSRNESAGESGYSHFVEHMLLKGTPTRSYTEISRVIDSLGGNINAFTSKDITCYHITVSADYIFTGLEVLSDIFFNSVFLQQDFETEKNVILEEIKMCDDDPEDVLFDTFEKNVFGDNAMGRSVIGSESSISSVNRDELYQYYLDKYCTEGSILALSGNLWASVKDKQKLIRKITTLFDQQGNFAGSRRRNVDNAFSWHVCEHVAHCDRAIQQNYCILGMPGFGVKDNRGLPLNIYSHFLGGNMSSVLFQTLREKQGLCYHVQAFHNQYLHEGVWGVYFITSEKNFLDILRWIHNEIKKLLMSYPDSIDFQETKNSLSGMLKLQMDSSYNRAFFHVNSLFYHNVLRSIEKEIRKIQSVNKTDLYEIIRSYWRDSLCVINSVGSLQQSSINKVSEEIVSRGS